MRSCQHLLRPSNFYQPCPPSQYCQASLIETKEQFQWFLLDFSRSPFDILNFAINFSKFGTVCPLLLRQKGRNFDSKMSNLPKFQNVQSENLPNGSLTPRTSCIAIPFRDWIKTPGINVEQRIINQLNNSNVCRIFSHLFKSEHLIVSTLQKSI